MANEVDELEKFLKLVSDATAPLSTSNAEIKLGNGDIGQEAEKQEPQTNGENVDTNDSNVGDAVVGSTTSENNDDQQPVKNGTNDTNDNNAEISENVVDSSNAADGDEWTSFHKVLALR